MMLEPPGGQQQRVLIIWRFKRFCVIHGNEIGSAIQGWKTSVFIKPLRAGVIGLGTWPL
jgi:hypothetical protein